MDSSRRQFILGSAASLILRSYYDRVLTYFENTGEPLIEAPGDSTIELFAVDRGGYGLELNWGDPWEELPEMTVREVAERYLGGVEEYVESFAGEEVDLDAPAEFETLIATYGRRDASNARAYHLLWNIDFGPTLSGGEAVIELEFIDGGFPGSDYLGVEVADEESIRVLQKRLDDLNTGIRISMAAEPPQEFR